MRTPLMLRYPALAPVLAAIACAPASTPTTQAPAPVARVDTVRVVDTVAARPTVPDTALQAGRFDNGKMWTFEYPPLAYFREAYGFAPDSAWFRSARLGALRLPNCTASFVSATGLVLTNHHCARESVVAVTRPGETPLDTGFYAATLADERRVPDLYIDQLIAIEDISAALDTVAAEARDAATEAVTAALVTRFGGDSAGIVVETVPLWNGAKTSAYVFRRFSDIRLVMAPELQLGFFGGDPDNFTYPRYALDMSFLRVYEDGEPYRPEVYFRWSGAGVQDGEPVFVIGNPGSTSRLQTVAQLEYRRDVGDKAILDFFDSHIGAMEAYRAEFPVQAESIDIRNKIFGLSNSQKAYGGILRGLQDPVIMARRQDADDRFKAAIARDPALQSQYGSLFDRIAQVQQQKTRYAADVRAFAGLGAPDWTPAVLLRGIWAFQHQNARRGGAPAGALSGLEQRLAGVGQQPIGLQERLLAARLGDIQRAYGDTSAFVRQLLGGATPAERARTIVTQSVLADSAQAVAALSSGTVADTDPGVVLASTVMARYFAYQQGSSPLDDDETALASEIGRAHFAVYGATMPPDATFSLRIADGVVRGYEYNGTRAPVFTTFFGLYDRHRSFAGLPDWQLPARWLKPTAEFDLGTPLNFVATADIIGGNSGSPVLNQKLELVGVAFDGNIESLPGDFIYLPEKNRMV
ncbi:MAG: S46 family peptidase, partial [Gemmatimonadota bacterium]|nr:S46 family peptidase [Gemmatimonadota bacterium]